MCVCVVHSRREAQVETISDQYMLVTGARARAASTRTTSPRWRSPSARPPTPSPTSRTRATRSNCSSVRLPRPLLSSPVHCALERPLGNAYIHSNPTGARSMIVGALMELIVTGVVGLKKRRYCLFGGTHINTLDVFTWPDLQKRIGIYLLIILVYCNPIARADTVNTASRMDSNSIVRFLMQRELLALTLLTWMHCEALLINK